MMRALLVCLYPHWNKPFPSPLPAGLASVAAVARQCGWDVKIKHGMDADNLIKEYDRSWNTFQLIGFDTYILNRSQTLKTAQVIKDQFPELPIVFGGIQATNFPEEFLRHKDAELVIRGEAEIAFKALLEAIEQKRDWRSIRGVSVLSDGKVVHNPPADMIDSLDDWPDPAWDLFPGGSGPEGKLGHILTFRGCPFRCAQCPHQKFGPGPVREYSIERVINQIIKLKENSGIEKIEFYDETFTLNRKRAIELSRALIDISAGLPWICYTRIGFIDPELVEIMKKAGCEEIFFGLGAGCARLLKVLNTDVDLGKVHEDILMVRKAGIKSTASFSLGIPTETKKESWETIKFGLKLPADRLIFQPSMPFPGSKLYLTARENGRFIISDWEEALDYSRIIYLDRRRKLSELKSKFLAVRLLKKCKKILRV